MVDCLEGRLLARSMLFKASEPRVLLQFQNATGADILVELDSGTLLELQIGLCYRLTMLDVKVYKFTGRQELVPKLVLRPTANTTCELIEQQPSRIGLSNCSCYQGTITNVMAPLCLYQLDDSTTWLCLAYVWERVELPTLRVGTHVKVFNAHRIHDCLVLCERGSLVVLRQADHVDDLSDTPRPLQWLVENWQLGFDDVLWLQHQYLVLEKKFGRMLSALPREDQAVSVSVLLVDLVKSMEKSREINNTLTLREIFLHHGENCCIKREGILRGTIVTLAQLLDDITVPLDCDDWKHRRVQYGTQPGEVPLVCRLTVDRGYFSAGDDTGSLPLLLAGDVQQRLLSVVGLVVIVPVYVRVCEVFQGDVAIKYLQAELKNVQDALDVRKLLPVVGALCPDCNHIRACRHVCPTPCSWAVSFHLLHKTSVIREGSKSDPYCHLVGRLHDPDYKLLNSSSSPAIVCLTVIDEMLPLEQVMCVGGTYQLRLSSSQLVNQASFPRWYYATDGSSSIVSRAFQLPQDVSAKLVSLTVPAYPRVKEAAAWRPEDENHMHMIRGVVVTRSHQLPPDSKRGTVAVPGFSIPGPRVMVLTLRDDGDLQDNEITIYANRWRHLHYPLGMVPGATVICSHLQKRLASSGRAYLFNSKFTRMSLENFRHAL